MASESPYHEGELAVQRRAGVARAARLRGRAIGDRIPGGAMDFIARQPMVAVGSVGRDGDVWASVLFGPPGFLRATDDRTLALDLARPGAAVDDPLWKNLGRDPRLGLLVIELATRRRLRVNGRARVPAGSRCVIDVEVAYPNCPRYIRRRLWRASEGPAFPAAQPDRRGTDLTSSQMAWIGRADTLFVASAHPRRGVDVSHRGGEPGFVQVPDSRTLRIPDYAGNGMFNTLGNFASHPRAGLAFVDFDRGLVLQLSGRAEVLWDVDDPRQETGGTRRYWQLVVESWRESASPYRLEWECFQENPDADTP